MSGSDERPVIGITMGDAAGIGPEIVVKALNNKDLRKALRCIVIGDAFFLRSTAAALGMDDSFEIRSITNLPREFDIATDSACTGRASAEYIAAAVTLWKQGEIDAVCTAPISKNAIRLGGYDFPGHTEFLASLTQTDKFAMSFFAKKLCVVLLSTHVPLSRAIAEVKQSKLVALVDLAARELSKLLGKTPKIAVAGLNPHASEGGMFGTEEHDEIEPAIARCQEMGLDVHGPFAPDTVFLRGFKGEFDAVIALYHDQATIAVKSLAFGLGVNVTLGLPLIRTSVDHGTAYDIAGQGIADASSMIEAIRLAGSLVSSSRTAK